jgi:hypothetical protein
MYPHSSCVFIIPFLSELVILYGTSTCGFDPIEKLLSFRTFFRVAYVAYAGYER